VLSSSMISSSSGSSLISTHSVPSLIGIFIMESKRNSKTARSFDSPRLSSVSNEQYFMTIRELKDSLKPRHETVIKTARSMYQQLQDEQSSLTGYKPPPQKEKRRSLKNYFAVSFLHGADHFKRDKQLLAITNPIALGKQKRMEDFDRKTMERRREQRILKNRIMFKES